MHTVRKVLTNDSAETVDVGLEPWGMYLPLESGRSFEIVAEATGAGDLEVVRNSGFVVYAWAGSMVKVYCEGKLIHVEGIPMPALPSGASTKEFMGLLGLDKIK